jgi:hypothetical protein
VGWAGVVGGVFVVAMLAVGVGVGVGVGVVFGLSCQVGCRVCSYWLRVCVSGSCLSLIVCGVIYFVLELVGQYFSI